MKTALIALLCAIGVVSCHGPASSPERFAVVLSVTADDGRALSGASLSVQQRVVGTTGASGDLQFDLTGKEGELRSITVACPPGFVLPEVLRPLRLTHTRRLDESAPEPTLLRANCARKRRKLVVVVRAVRGGGLPVQIDGKPSGATDPAGILHLLIEADRDVSSIGVTLDTRERAALRPQNPSRTFEVGDRDAVLVFDQSFVVEKTAPPRHRRPAPRRVPYRID